MPEHLHCAWPLPEGDADYSVRWGAIKARFVMGLRGAGNSAPSELPVVRTGRYAGLKPGLRVAKREAAVWQRRFWDEAREQTIRGIVCRAERAKPIFATNAITTPISGIVGSEMRPGNDPGDHFSRERAEPEVKHGFVERPEDWPYSSVHRDMRLGRYGP